MFKILGILFFGLIALLILGVAILGRVLGGIFGMNSRTFHGHAQSREGANRPRSSSANQQETATADSATSRAKREKLFDKDEGEYVEFEEVKDDK